MARRPKEERRAERLQRREERMAQARAHWAEAKAEFRKGRALPSHERRLLTEGLLLGVVLAVPAFFGGYIFGGAFFILLTGEAPISAAGFGAIGAGLAVMTGLIFGASRGQFETQRLKEEDRRRQLDAEAIAAAIDRRRTH